MIHSIDIIHADIAARNILLVRKADGQLAAHLTDFGLSANNYSSVDLAKAKPWRSSAPEAWLMPARWAKQSDVFSFGCLMLELISLDKPFPTTVQQPGSGEAVRALLRRISELHPLPAAQPALRRIVQRCWTFEAAERPTMGEVLNELYALRPKQALEDLHDDPDM